MKIFYGENLRIHRWASRINIVLGNCVVSFDCCLAGSGPEADSSRLFAGSSSGGAKDLYIRGHAGGKGGGDGKEEKAVISTSIVHQQSRSLVLIDESSFDHQQSVDPGSGISTNTGSQCFALRFSVVEEPSPISRLDLNPLSAFTCKCIKEAKTETLRNGIPDFVSPHHPMRLNMRPFFRHG